MNERRESRKMNEQRLVGRKKSLTISVTINIEYYRIQLTCLFCAFFFTGVRFSLDGVLSGLLGVGTGGWCSRGELYRRGWQ